MRNRLRFLHYLQMTLSAFLGLLLISCSRQTEELSQLTLNLPQTILTQSGSKPLAVTAFHFIAVTVSGSGMAPLVWRWEARSQCPTCSDSALPTAPASVNFSVPTGDRWIQVMALSGASTSVFYYGDQRRNLASGADSASVTLTEVGGTGIEGQVAGRYLKADGTGPTGKLRMYIHPVVSGVSRPAMALFETDIIAGWFSLFFVTGFNFTYVIEKTGERIFDNKDLNAVTGSGNSTTILVPASYEMRESTTQGYLREASQQTLGYFGPGASASGKTLCYPSSALATYTYEDINLTKYLNFVASGGTSANMSVVSGGGTSCSDVETQSYVNQLHFRPYYPNRSEDRPFGIKGPFRYLSASGPGAFIERENILGYDSPTSSSRVKLSWKYLPGTSGEIDGVGVYMKFGPMAEGGGPFGISCSYLSNMGFTLVEEIPYATTTTEISASKIPATTSRFALPFAHFVLCPFKEGAGPQGSRLYFNSAVSSTSPHTNGPTTVSFYPVLVAKTFEDQILTYGTCKGLSLHLIGTDGKSYTPSSAVNLSLSATSFDGSGSLGFYSDSSCSSGLSQSISTTTSSKDVYVKHGGGSSTVYQLSASSANASSPSLFADGLTTSLGSGSATGIQATMKTLSGNLLGGCYPIYIRRVSSSSPTTDTTSALLSSVSADKNSKFFMDARCDEATIRSNAHSLASDEYGKVLYVRPEEVGSATVTLTPSAGTSATTTASYTSHLPSALALNASSSVMSVCSSYKVSLTNSSGVKLVPNLSLTHQITFTLTSGSGIKVYTSSTDCLADASTQLLTLTSGSQTLSVTNSRGYDSATLYLRALPSTSASFTATATNSSLGVSSSVDSRTVTQ